MFANRLLLSAVLLVGSFVQTASSEILTQFTDPCSPNKAVKNRARIVKKRETLNLCFYWS